MEVDLRFKNRNKVKFKLYLDFYISMREVLVFTEHYLPGYKGGGPIVSISNMVNKISSVKFKILTKDHDFGDFESYPNIKREEWNTIGNSSVYYLSDKNLSFFKSQRELINRTTFDLYYFNSFFSILYTLYPIILRKIKKIPQKAALIAPRNEFLPNLLEIKKLRKKIYIILFKLLNLHKGIIWQACNDLEKAIIQSAFGENTKIFVAYNLVSSNLNISDGASEKIKKPGQLNIIFLSRLVRNKNLDYALTLLKSLKGNVNFEIFGPIEDKKYWNECKDIIASLPKNTKVIYKGIFKKSDNINIFQKNHVFLFPTKGENFGHVIFESLNNGCPVIVSDQTPWKNLSNLKVGWEISLSNPEKYIKVLNELINMNGAEYKELSKSAAKYAERIANNQDSINRNIELFEYALNLYNRKLNFEDI